MGESPELSNDTLGSQPPPIGDAPELSLPYKDARRRVLDEFEGRYLKHVLEAAGGNVASAARHAGMDRTYLIKLLQRHRLR